MSQTELVIGDSRSTPAMSGLIDLEMVSLRLEHAPPERVVAWAVDSFGQGLALAASFQDSVLIDIAVKVDPAVEVLFLDTGFHFDATWDYVERVREHYDLNLKVVRPEVDSEAWPCGTERCCEVRKVRPLQRALGGKRAWMTGLRRVDTAERNDAPIVSLDLRQGLVKVNPLAAWSDADVHRYVRGNRLLVHPLSEEGYASIGCEPTTDPVVPGQDPRAGRWPGDTKTECGLHL